MHMSGVMEGINCRSGQSPWFSRQQSFSRPANTTQYTAKDVCNSANLLPLEFASIARSKGEPFFIFKPLLLSDNPASTPGSFILRLYKQKFAIANDNAIFDPTFEQNQQLVGVILFDSSHLDNSNAVYYPSSFNHLFIVPDPDDTSIYGVLLDGNAYTPVASERFTITLAGAYLDNQG